MHNDYRPAEIEPRWQAHWAKHRTFRAVNPGDRDFDPSRPKYYVLDMFPYPSGAGLHVGHALGYVATDIIARRKRMQGFNVLHPMGWDAFGLPAEQYAIQTGKKPTETTAENTANFRAQLQRIGLSYDWEREISTADPSFYRWTQWLFKRLYERGLLYQAEVPVWWCEELKTVLANEEVINGRSERGNYPCVRRPLKQWMFQITAYAERLLEDLSGLDWPESIKAMQRDWIGRSEGAEIEFPIEGRDERLTVFTTRPDTVFGATFMVVAPEHPLLAHVPAAHRAAVTAYQAAAASKSELERTDLAKEKTGVFTGIWARNPVFPEGSERARIPIWVADYVLMSYGTGAIMAVPGQDQRDWDFAEQYGLPIIRTVRPSEGFTGKAYLGEGPSINSDWLDGLGVEDAKRRAIEWLEREGYGRARVTYKLRDWLFSRQRYWGEPFPLLYVRDGDRERIVPVQDEELPVLLPDMEDFRPAADGSPPLARCPEWVHTVDPGSGKPARRETDTMPGWAGSCWYWLRFMDPRNDQEPFSAQAERFWGQVDLYIGGASHAVMHLLYARFWHKVFYDAGFVSAPEPFRKLFNQGMILAFAYEDETGRNVPGAEVEARGEQFVRKADGARLEQIVTKMAKQLGNVVNPDDIVAEFGADTLRLYEMFMGPLEESKPWNPRDIPGCRRFLDRVWRILVDPESEDPIRPEFRAMDAREPSGAGLELERLWHRTLVRVEGAFEHFNFNTAIAALMTFVNEAMKRPGALTRSQAERFVLVLSPFAPHICEELWMRLGHRASLSVAPWPQVDERYLAEEEVTLVVQVNGKVRGHARVARETQGAELEQKARAEVTAWVDGKQAVKTIVVPGKLVNFVVR